MSKCVHCNKHIDTEWDTNFEHYGLDGDVIHKDCKEGRTKEITKINNMSDKEFNGYMLGK